MFSVKNANANKEEKISSSWESLCSTFFMTTLCGVDQNLLLLLAKHWYIQSHDTYSIFSYVSSVCSIGNYYFPSINLCFAIWTKEKSIFHTYLLTNNVILLDFIVFFSHFLSKIQWMMPPLPYKRIEEIS